MNKPDDSATEPESAEKSLSDTVLSGGKWLGMAALAQALLQIVVVAVLARLLSPAQFGLAAIAGIFIDLAAGIAALGASQALVQRHDLDVHHIRAAFWISIGTGLSITAALFLASPWLATILGSPEAAPLIAALSGTFTIRALAYVSEGLAARQLNFRILAIRQLASYTIGYGVVGIGSALLGAGAWALVYAQIVEASLIALLLIAAIRFDWRPTRTWSAYRDILGYGTGSSVAQIINSLANQADRAIVSINANPAAVGIYTRALQITNYPYRLIGKVVEDVLFPSFAGVQNDVGRLSSAYYRSTGSIFVVMTPVSVFFCLSAGPLTSVLLGPQWSGVVPLIVAFAVSIPFRSAQRVGGALIRAVGRSWLIAALQVFFFAGTALGALIGIRFGLLGAAIGVTGAVILHYLALTIACVLALELDSGRLLARHFAGLPLAVLAATGAAIGAWATAAGLIDSFVALILSAVISAAVTLSAVLVAPRLMLSTDGQWLATLLLSKGPEKWRTLSVISALSRKIAR
ncbi:putative Polysaccharide biosynthesis protein [uncultured Mycobacterium sp.]|uniref:Putative Polysaccharide biosynthesis protein n=1 Tax=uncultured Mycobacterium sp. TaxID=171292 RepID=A0A1Y5PEW2_9MYCO|nr:putative Polysaccharide biosynthesis protein [uncultured Mycobacterium sp.]